MNNENSLSCLHFVTFLIQFGASALCTVALGLMTARAFLLQDYVFRSFGFVVNGTSLDLYNFSTILRGWPFLITTIAFGLLALVTGTGVMMSLRKCATRFPMAFASLVFSLGSLVVSLLFMHSVMKLNPYVCEIDDSDNFKREKESICEQVHTFILVATASLIVGSVCSLISFIQTFASFTNAGQSKPPSYNAVVVPESPLMILRQTTV